VLCTPRVRGRDLAKRGEAQRGVAGVTPRRGRVTRHVSSSQLTPTKTTPLPYSSMNLAVLRTW
jgi:hypothetical protein